MFKKKKETNKQPHGETRRPPPQTSSHLLLVEPHCAGSRNKHCPLHPQELSLVRGWDVWLASPTQGTWVWANSKRWWRTGEAGVLQSMGLQRVGHDWAAELNWTELKSLSHVWLFLTPWTLAYQVPPSMGFSRQEYCRGLPFPSPGDLPDPGIEPGSPTL